VRLCYAGSLVDMQKGAARLADWMAGQRA